MLTIPLRRLAIEEILLILKTLILLQLRKEIARSDIDISVLYEEILSGVIPEKDLDMIKTTKDFAKMTKQQVTFPSWRK